MAHDKNDMTGWGELDPDLDLTPLSAEAKAEQKKKNLVVGGALVAFVALVFFVTMAKLAQNFGA